VGDEPESVLPVLDANMNEWSPWHDYTWGADLWHGLMMQSRFHADVILPGVASLTACSKQHDNFQPGQKHRIDGVHRSIPTAGSFSYLGHFAFETTREVQAGEELLLSCLEETEDDLDQWESESSSRSLAWLQENGLCLDNLSVHQSTLPGVGRGAFSKRRVKAGEVITSAPVLHLDRSQLQIVEQEYNDDPFVSREHNIEYTAKVVGQQLLLNYCYGHSKSNVLLLPLAPGVNYINHDQHKMNARIRWSKWSEKTSTWLDLPATEIFDMPSDGSLVIEYEALLDIEAGDEIFLDYGTEWDQAWKEHVNAWSEHESIYISADDFNRINGKEHIRTQSEQISNPYPSNLRTACFFRWQDVFPEKEEVVEWSRDNFNCLRPCDVEKRAATSKAEEFFYTATIYPMESAAEPEYCGSIPNDGIQVTALPRYAVTLVDRTYTSDIHLEAAFRHEIGVQDNFFPDKWTTVDRKPLGDFVASPLEPGKVAPFRWEDTGEIVTPFAFRLGLDKRVREVLLDYCNRMGITDIFRHVTIDNNPLKVEQNQLVRIHGYKWYLQRPDSVWRSNLHWLSPADNDCHQNYLQALSLAGFNDTLKSIGESLGLKSIVVFHVTFIAVSISTKGYMHFDVTGTGGKAFNVIIPLILANETGPELDLQDSKRSREGEGELKVGRNRYEYDVATVLGDDAYHATSAVDYRVHKQFRMAATVYVAEVNEDNVDAIVNDFTQPFPPADRDLLLQWSGQHYRSDDQSARLPEPSSDHILITYSAKNVK